MKTQGNTPTKWIVLVKTFKAKNYVTFGFDCAKSAKGFKKDAELHGATCRLYKEAK